MEISEKDVLLLLHAAIARHGGSKGKFASAHNLPHTTISMSLNNSGGDNRRRFPDSLLTALGVRRREVYEVAEAQEEAA